MKLSWGSLAFLFGLIAMLTSASASSVLVYHQISADSRSTSADDMVSLPAFTEQMAWLYANGYRTISTETYVDAMLKRKSLPAKTFVLHFDDGWKSQLLALPILRRFRFQATFWIIAGCAGAPYPYLAWDDLQNLLRDPLFEVFSHTMTHPYFAKDDVDEEWQLSQAKLLLEQNLERHVPYLAWPYGYTNHRLINEAVKAGYVAAFTIYVNDAQVEGDRFRLPRTGISGACTIKDIQAFLSGEQYHCHKTD